MSVGFCCSIVCVMFLVILKGWLNVFMLIVMMVFLYRRVIVCVVSFVLEVLVLWFSCRKRLSS